MLSLRGKHWQNLKNIEISDKNGGGGGNREKNAEKDRQIGRENGQKRMKNGVKITGNEGKIEKIEKIAKIGKRDPLSSGFTNIFKRTRVYGRTPMWCKKPQIWYEELLIRYFLTS